MPILFFFVVPPLLVINRGNDTNTHTMSAGQKASKVTYSLGAAHFLFFSSSAEAEVPPLFFRVALAVPGAGRVAIDWPLRGIAT